MTNKIFVSAIHDYIIEISGLNNYQQNQIFCLKNNQEAKLMVISASQDKAFCIAKKSFENYKIREEVIEDEQISQIKTSNSFFGKIIDIDNNIVFPEGNKTVGYLNRMAETFNVNNPLMTYQPLEEQLYTGYSVIDLLIPIGKGQRELIIGDRKTGKTYIALNTIINQKGKNVKCIYVAIGQQQTQVAATYQMLKEHQADEYTIIVNAPADKPYEQYLAPYVAMAHAENLSHTEDVLIIFDDLTKHANIYREIALLINKPVGKEAFPSDMFYAHARLLERSGKFANRKTITALPILQTVDNDITSLVASNVISITDGQIVTNSELFALNKYPAIDVNLSVSRIGGGVQNKIINQTAKVVGKLYHSFKKQAKLIAVKYDLNEEMNSLMLNGLQIEKMFNQKGISSYDPNDMFITAKLIEWNLLNKLQENEIQQAIKFITLYSKINDDAKKVVSELTENAFHNVDMAKDYFAFILKSYSDKFKLNWNIAANRSFLEINYQDINEVNDILEGAK
ncbi:MSC_0619 family F1-like ATPase alpha subunit [Mycoplasmopsis iners]|uniref:MSC_0619 family F1-like ATPase alpha subunit n=1 Tax=Mycoplasmopsis iners TaxID=76630 RepID=UPI0004986105|nr:ATP F0F1 synthase subunit alpha [Mycoplasmopsis iners]